MLVDLQRAADRGSPTPLVVLLARPDRRHRSSDRWVAGGRRFRYAADAASGRPPDPTRSGLAAWVGCTIGPMPIYLDHAATTPLRREVLDAMLPYLTESFGNPSSAHASGGPREPASTRRTSASPRGSTRSGREIVFTSGGTEANNLALKGVGVGGQGARPSDRHLLGRAPRGRPHAALPREVRLRDRRVAGRSLRPGRPRPARGGDQRQDDPRLGHARQQRGRHDPADRRDRRPGPRPQGRRSSTSTRSRPRRTWISTSTRWAPTWCRSARTSSRARRASGRCTSGTGRTSSPSSRAVPRSGTDGPAPRTSPAPSASRPRMSCRVRERPATVARLRRQRDRLATALRGDPRRRADRPPEGPPARPAVGHRARHGRRVGRDGARPRGDRLFGRLRVHDRLDRGQPRPDRDGLPGRGGTRRAPPVARPDDDRRRDRGRVRGRPARRRLDAASAPSPSPPTRSARVCPRESDPRRDVGRGRLLGRGGAPPCSRATRSSASGCACTTSPTRTPSSRRAAARSTPPTTRDGSRPSSTSRSTS